MGDRGQVKMRERGREVYLYTHWGASVLVDDVRAALLRAQQDGRLDDAAYLSRIIFCQMMPAEDHYETTGFGISLLPTDGKEIVIDVDDQTIQSQEYGITIQSLKDFIHNTEGYDDDDEEDADYEA